MPERTVQRINRLDHAHGTHAHKYCVDCDIETWDSFSLTGHDGEYIICKVASLSDPLGKVLAVVGKSFRFKTYYYISQVSVRVCRLLLPDGLVKGYGVKDGQLIDLYLLRVIRPNGTREEIFPKRLSIGRMDGRPKPSEDIVLPSSNLLIEKEFTDKFYSDLAFQINMAYGYGIHCAVLVLVRKIFENLLIDLLRARYGMKRLELFFWKERGMHHSLSVLIKNLSENVSDFRPFTSAFDDEFFKFLNDLREKAGASAHSIHVPSLHVFLNRERMC